MCKQLFGCFNQAYYIYSTLLAFVADIIHLFLQFSRFVLFSSGFWGDCSKPLFAYRAFVFDLSLVYVWSLRDTVKAKFVTTGVQLALDCYFVQTDSAGLCRRHESCFHYLLLNFFRFFNEDVFKGVKNSSERL